MYEVIETLSHLRQLGIVHGDVKSQNIMTVRTGDRESKGKFFKLVDFGLAMQPRKRKTELNFPGFSGTLVPRWRAVETKIKRWGKYTDDVEAIFQVAVRVIWPTKLEITGHADQARWRQGNRRSEVGRDSFGKNWCENIPGDEIGLRFGPICHDFMTQLYDDAGNYRGENFNYGDILRVLENEFNESDKYYRHSVHDATLYEKSYLWGNTMNR